MSKLDVVFSLSRQLRLETAGKLKNRDRDLDQADLGWLLDRAGNYLDFAAFNSRSWVFDGGVWLQNIETAIVFSNICNRTALTQLFLGK